jgi:hypothetical protein
MPQALFLATIIPVMIGAGLLGGLVNYFVTRRDDPEGSSFWKSATLGIAASLLVPLFLNMISSSLLDSIRTGTPNFDSSKVLVFLGFCLVAAISSTSFIKTLSDRILQEARDAKKAARQADKKVSEVQSAIQPIVEKETEAEETPSDAITNLVSQRTVMGDKERRLLQKLANGRWVLRTRTGLAKETQIPKPEVDAMMENLRERKLVDYKWIAGKTEKKRRWYITNEGRAAIAQNIETQNREGATANGI